MARMIPSGIHEDCQSAGEREVFRRLRDSQDTEGWIVLHSLDVADHRRQTSGEADFLIIIPSKGILCLEVKACSQVRRQGGNWYYGTHAKPDSRGPFKQASETMHSLRERLIQRRPDLSGVVFWSAVMFPYTVFSAKSAEWQDWQVIDAPSFRRNSPGKLLEDVLDRARAHLESCQTASWFHPSSREPYPEQCEAIAQALRPDFEFFESPRSRSLRLSEELRYYTEEQYAALDAMATNTRVVFAGPAGTGKTLLAIETARRGRSAGRHVLFLCYNRLIGNHLREQTASLRPEVVTRTVHEHMVSISGVPPDRYEGERDYWEVKLPKLALEKLIVDSPSGNLFDELVIDEAQDILRDSYLDVLDLSLRGGLSAGRWRFFGDFEKQAIYRTANLSLGEFVTSRGVHAPVYSLRTNCRNTPRIAGFARLLGGLDPDYYRVLRSDNGIEPEVIYYSDMRQQQELFVQVLDQLCADKYSGHDIAILSAKPDTGCVASLIGAAPWKDRLRLLESAKDGQIGYCSVAAFKGMESPVVVVTDIESAAGDDSSAILYVAVTRGFDRLVILANESVKGDVVKAVLGKSKDHGG